MAEVQLDPALTQQPRQTAPTRFQDVSGAFLAYRRFGGPSARPLVMLQHFRGNLDNWDPGITDALSAKREVVLVDYARCRPLD